MSLFTKALKNLTVFTALAVGGGAGTAWYMIEAGSRRAATEGMKAKELKAWRKRLGLKQREAALLLGVKKRVFQYYEGGMRGDRKVRIPKAIELACYALDRGVTGYDGERVTGRASSRRRRGRRSSPVAPA